MSKRAFPVSVDAARAALAVIPRDDRDVWWRMGMALKSEFGEDGLQLFQDWSEGERLSISMRSNRHGKALCRAVPSR